ncbi:MAG: radical SAM protein [Lentisphaeria bacterium]|nr:radical SAM protein [Lentisphaeria bacterium]
MIGRFAWRLLRETDPRLLWKLVHTLGWKGMRAIRSFERRRDRGETFPAFLFLSITNACNLRCQGCWVTQSSPPKHLELETLNRIIEAGKQHGCSFYGILGGEPFLHPRLFDLLRAHPDCYFQVFTNGTLITPETAAALRRLGNVTPLISIEGSESVSDVRRGGARVFARSLEGLQACARERLFTGVACSICKSNLEDLAGEPFARRLVELGVHYLWYYIYRPVGPRPAPELALDRDEVRRLRRHIVALRRRAPLLVVDSYWDHDGKALCPAALGISHHVNPFGDLEPCPIIQFAADNLARADDIAGTIAHSPFLDRFRDAVPRRTRGCIVLEDPAALANLLRETGARDTTGRGTGFAELAALCPCQSHHMPGDEVPEDHWAYRFAKKHWFFGFGAYG